MRKKISIYDICMPKCYFIFQIIGGTSIDNVIANPPVAGDNSQWCGRSFNWEKEQNSIIADVESVCSKFQTNCFQ